MHQVLQGATQVVLEALHAAGNGVRLAGKAGFEFGLQLLLAAAHLGDFRLQGVAALLQILQRQLHDGVGIAG